MCMPLYIVCLSERGCLSFVSDWFHDQFPCHFSVVEGKGNKVPPTACHSSVTIAVMQANKTPLCPFLYLFLLPLSLSPPHDAVTYEDCISIMIKNSDLSSFFFFFFLICPCDMSLLLTAKWNTEFCDPILSRFFIIYPDLFSSC